MTSPTDLLDGGDGATARMEEHAFDGQVLDDISLIFVSVARDRRPEFLHRLQRFYKGLARTTNQDKVSEQSSASLDTPAPQGFKSQTKKLATLQRKRKRSHPDDDVEMDEASHENSRSIYSKDRPRIKKSTALHRRARAAATDVGSVTLAFSETCDIHELRLIQSRYLAELTDAIQADNSQLTQVGAGIVAQGYREFFFEGVVGSQVLDHLTKICQGYQVKPTEAPLTGLTDLLTHLALKDGMPVEVKDCYETLHLYASYTKTNTAEHLEHPEMQKLQEMRWFCTFSVKFDRLHTKLLEEDGELTTFFKSKGLEADKHKGGSWEVSVIKYLSEIVGLPQESVRSMKLRIHGVVEFVKYFGEGILPFLPILSASKLTMLSGESLTPASTLLQKHLPELRLVCDWADQYIYQPVVNEWAHLPVRTEVLSSSSSSPTGSTLLRILYEAIDTPGYIELFENQTCY